MFPSWMRSRNDIPRPMYFFAIETTSRRFALGQLLARVAPDPDDLAAPVAHLGRRRDLGVEAHPLEQVGVVAGLDPALERRERDVVAGPVVDRPQPRVVARVEVPVVDREVGPVERAAGTSRGRASRCRPRPGAFASLSRSLVPSDWTSLPALTRWKSGVGGSRSVTPCGERLGDHRVGLGAERQPVLRSWSCGSCARCRGASTRGATGPPSTARDDLLARARSPWRGRPPPRR